MKKRRPFARIALGLLLVAAAIVVLWLGMVPARYLPFLRVDLADPTGLFLDLRLAALRSDRQMCAEVLTRPHIVATPIADKPFRNDCGWRNAVRVQEVGGARLPAAQLTCETAAALALWMTHEVQPLAEAILGSRVVSARQMGTYACRDIIGNAEWRRMRSQHSRAHAIDIGGFRLADGRTISLTRHWNKGSEGVFLRRVHARACRYFRVALSPEFNAAHRDHFHFDRGPLWTCR